MADISKIKVGGVEYDVKDVTARDGLDDKVDKVTGKGLSTEDYTTAEKNKLAGIDENANNYTHPSTHSASIIDEDSTHRFVTDEEINTWNSKASTDVATTEANGLMSSEDKAMLEEHEQQISQNANMKLTNLVTNGNFANGTTGYSANNATISASDNVLYCTGSGATAAQVSVWKSNFTFIDGHKYYTRIKAKVTNSDCLSLAVKSYPIVSTFAEHLNPVIDTVITLAGGITYGGADTTGGRLYLNSLYESAAATAGKITQTWEWLCIDTTEVFGTGNEPTDAEMNALMAIIPNGWFDATLTLTQKQITTWMLNLIRANTAAIVAL